MTQGSHSVAGIVAAAGQGERLGEGPKALVEIDGEPIVRIATRALLDAGIGGVVVVHPPGDEAAFEGVLAGLPVTLAPGGATRTDSVRAGVALVGEDVDLVAIHDAARPLVPPAVIVGVVRAVQGEVVAAAPGLPVADTLKRVEAGRVVETVDREGIWAIQTPQVIRRDVLRAALERTDDMETDDLALVEAAIRAGVVEGQVAVVAGSPQGLKITFPEDLGIARAVGAQPSVGLQS